MKINIGVIFGGRSGEYEVSLQSARAIVSQLDHDKYEIWPIAVARDGRWYGPIPEADVPTFDPAHYLGREVMLPANPAENCSVQSPAIWSCGWMWSFASFTGRPGRMA